MPDAVTPIFLLSPPRSGSTLLQRILAGHSRIASSAENWLLLPLLSMRRSQGVRADYSHGPATVGIGRLLAEMPDGEPTYRAAVRDFALRLYNEASHEGSRYFLDKCPRYDVIADQLVTYFPEARFIFLWRNPLGMIGSQFETFRHYPRGMMTNWIDLYPGMVRLIEAQQGQRGMALSLRYEDLLAEPGTQWARICDYLDLEVEPEALEAFQTRRFARRGGDPTGQYTYTALSDEPLTKWRDRLANPVRRAWTRRYLRWLGDKRIAAMGYDLSRLEADLGGVSRQWRGAGRDAAQLAYGWMYERLKHRLIGTTRW